MSLEQELGLVEPTPIDSVEFEYKEPSADRLKQVPKAQQTAHLVECVVSNDGIALRYASKKLITYDICKIAIQENGLALKFVPNNLITIELCGLAVGENGLALEYVPQELKSAALVRKAVKFYYPIHYSYSYFHRRKRSEAIAKGKIRGEKLMEQCKYPIAYVPECLFNKKLIMEAVKYSPHSLRDVPQAMISKDIVLTAVSIDGTALCYSPKDFVDKTIIDVAIASNPFALEYIPDCKLTKAMCNKCFEKEPLVIRYMPGKYLTATLCNTAVQRNPDAYMYIPNEYKTLEMCLDIIRGKHLWRPIQFDDIPRGRRIEFDDFPVERRNDKIVLDTILEIYPNGAARLLEWNKQKLKEYSDKDDAAEPLYEETVAYLKERQVELSLSQLTQWSEILKVTDNDSLQVPLEQLDSNCLPIKYENNARIVHDFANDDISAKKIYYITDIHLEHQIKPAIDKIIQEENEVGEKLNIKLLIATDDFLNYKIQELVSSAEANGGILLIGGDVANNKELTIMFYEKLKSFWRGKIIFILGNHELWDGYTERVINLNARSVDEIVNEYRERVNNRDIPVSEWFCNIDFLENDIFIEYKNKYERIVREEQILNSSNEELTDLCSKASIIILGGIGFSGKNPHYNANIGLYSSTITSLKQDKEFTERFYKVYCKLNKCAGSKQVIVLTHNPVQDWLNEPCNPNWIYVNGHTHHNSLVREENGISILSDNQIGYKPQKWSLNAIALLGWYDPFENYEDGIYKITSEQYREFNVGRGIKCKGCNYQGQIYMLKRNGLYMFLLETSVSLYLLIGGKIEKLKDYDVDYYYDNMSLYGQNVRNAIKPYQQALEAISKEVKSFGGRGVIHGCIVDISYYSHIYVNPFDGRIALYWALDMTQRLVFKNIKKLLEEKEPQLMERFKHELKKNNLQILGKPIVKRSDIEIPTIPKWVIGTKMYLPSRIMRSVQYIWSQNVIRVWNEDILFTGTNNVAIEEGEKKFST